MEELKTCRKCGVAKPPDAFYNRARVNGLTYTCKECHRKAIAENKKDPTKHNFWYKRYERIRNSAQKRGLEFDLTLDDIRDLKSQKVCQYCKREVEVITLDRADNNKGYIKGNIIPACIVCNKIKGQVDFNKEEMDVIGLAVNNYYRRHEQRTTSL